MAVPNFEKFFLPVLKSVQDNEQSVKSALPFVAQHMNLTEQDLLEPTRSNKSTQAVNRVYWAKTYLNQAGLTENHRRGFFKITNLGKKVLGENLEEISVKTLQNYEGFREFQKRSFNAKNTDDPSPQTAAEEPTSRSTPEEKIETGISEINGFLKQEILNKIAGCSPKFFEILILDLLRAMGYGIDDDSALHVGGPGDEGVDGVISQDVLGLDKIYIQAKRYKADNIISGQHISNFCGALGFKGASKGIFVTTSRFSAQAVDLHTKNSNQKVILIDGDMLTELMIKYNVGLSVEKTYEVKRIDSDYFQDDLQ